MQPRLEGELFLRPAAGAADPLNVETDLAANIHEGMRAVLQPISLQTMSNIRVEPVAPEAPPTRAARRWTRVMLSGAQNSRQEAMPVTEPSLTRAAQRGRGTVPAGMDGIDRHIGLRIKLRRTLAGLSQTALGERMGVSFQQVQKYENGISSLTAMRLWQIADALDVPISYFFDGLPVDKNAADRIVPPPEFMPRETVELMRCFHRLPDSPVRRLFLDLMKAMVAVLEEAGAVENR